MTEAGEPRDVTFSSQYKYTLLQNTSTKKPFTLFMSPEKAWSLTNFGQPVTAAALEDFRVEAIQDFETLKEDAVIDGVKYEAGQPLPEEVLFYQQGGYFGEEKTRRISEEATERKLFVTGEVNSGKPDAESVTVPYKHAKGPLKTATKTDGKGGFVIDEDKFFDLQSLGGGTGGLY